MSILKREQALVFKARANPQVYAFTAQLLMYVLKDSSDWPKSVAKVTKYVMSTSPVVVWYSFIFQTEFSCILE